MLDRRQRFGRADLGERLGCHQRHRDVVVVEHVDQVDHGARVADLSECVGAGEAHVDRVVVEGGQQKGDGGAVAQQAERVDHGGADGGGIVEQGFDQRLDRLAISGATERLRGQPADVGVGVAQQGDEGGGDAFVSLWLAQIIAHLPQRGNALGWVRAGELGKRVLNNRLVHAVSPAGSVYIVPQAGFVHFRNSPSRAAGSRAALMGRGAPCPYRSICGKSR